MKSSNTALKKCFASIVAALVFCSCYLASIKNVVYADYNQGIVTFVTSLYSDCLGRSPDPTGLNDWCSKLASGQISGKEAAYGFFFSSEFTSKANALGDGDFVDAYYKVFLNRSADESGKSYWINQIANTTNDISILFTGFADSIEFANKCASYGINAGPHINVPTTVRGSSSGGGGGNATNTSLQSAAESVLATARSRAAQWGYTEEYAEVVRNTSTQYGIAFSFYLPCGADGDWHRIRGIIKAEAQNGTISLYFAKLPYGTPPSEVRNYDSSTILSSIDLLDNVFEEFATET